LIIFLKEAYSKNMMSIMLIAVMREATSGTEKNCTKNWANHREKPPMEVINVQK
jgi:hypothetical protein